VIESLRHTTCDLAQVSLAESELDPAHVAPEDRSCTHRARLSARAQRAALQEFGVEALACRAYDIRLGVAGAVTTGHDGILGFDNDVAIRVDQERAERMVTVIARSLREFEWR
jgi:hypothetical protein